MVGDSTSRSLLTGTAGFIGSHLSHHLLVLGHQVLGIDCLTDYCLPELKQLRLRNLQAWNDFKFLKLGATRAHLSRIVGFVDYVRHLAAQPSVRGRWSKNFETYVRIGILATQAVLEALKGTDVKKVIFVSSSSIYDDATEFPTSEGTNPRPIAFTHESKER